MDNEEEEIEDEDDGPCKTCGGSGVVSTDESDGEGNTMKGVGTQKCPDCKGEVADEDEEDDEDAV
jgi:DnaJ-class molecular chaperone